MKIKKLGHCCLVIETDGKRVMTDPGSYTVSEQEMEKNIDLIVITHEHQDHLHVDSLKKILTNNPGVVVVTNSGVGKILDETGIEHQKLEDGGSGEFAGVYLEAHGDKHAEIYEDFGQVQNTGYFIDQDLFYPGDSFTDPGKKVEILALPVLAPWLKIKESIDYAIALNPKVCFPVHDWNIKSPGFLNNIPKVFLEKNNIIFKVLEIGEQEEV
jgi:L-ascorbate metabolism protein UlaG (beta-lactamase superfamily)